MLVKGWHIKEIRLWSQTIPEIKDEYRPYEMMSKSWIHNDGDDRIINIRHNTSKPKWRRIFS